MALGDLLHDEIDEFEGVVERAASDTDSLIRERIRDLLHQTQDPLAAMALVAREVEDKVVTDQTTEAFLLFGELGRKRSGAM